MGTRTKKHAVSSLIRRWRLERGLSQEELAAKAGLESGSKAIYRYETGRVTPGVDILAQIADALELPLDALVREQPLSLPDVPEDVRDFALKLASLERRQRRFIIDASSAIIDGLGRLTNSETEQ